VILVQVAFWVFVYLTIGYAVRYCLRRRKRRGKISDLVVAFWPIVIIAVVWQEATEMWRE